MTEAGLDGLVAIQTMGFGLLLGKKGEACLSAVD